MAPSTQRYERVGLLRDGVPQTQDDLYSLHTVSDSYNYGSGVPSSPPPSFHSSANIRPSIPSSHSAPGPITPSGTGYSNSTPSYHTARHPLTSSNLAALPENDVSPPYAYPSNGAPETLLDAPTVRDDATIQGDADSENPLIINLHKRISQLETSMGRLLIQNDSLRAALADTGSSPETPGKGRGNCCVSYAGDDEELREMMRGSGNCCVSIGGKRDGEGVGMRRRREEWVVLLAVLCAGLFVVVIVFINAVFRPGKDGSSEGYKPPSGIQ